MSRSLAAALLALATIPFSARSADVTDLWWNSSQSGWGVNVVGQGGTLFLTFFVYGSNGQPLWLVAPSTQFQSTNSAGANVYSDPLYQTTGPWFGGGSFNPNAVSVTQVGSVTFTHTATSTATLSYTVNGVTVSTSLTRQTWAGNPYLAGQYSGALVIDSATTCTTPAGTTFFVNVRIALSGSTMQLTTTNASTGASCTISGQYTQEGSMTGIPNASLSCTDGTRATGRVYRMEANTVGLTGRIEMNTACREVSNLAAVWKAD